jgi:hypothetical protein
VSGDGRLRAAFDEGPAPRGDLNELVSIVVGASDLAHLW